jgi:hypothetical protein
LCDFEEGLAWDDTAESKAVGSVLSALAVKPGLPCIYTYIYTHIYIGLGDLF